MMELPESYMLSNQMNEKLTGKIISEIQILQTPHKFAFFKGDISEYPENRKLSAKAFLATEQRIPGLGNGVLQDILWDAGIDPRFPMAQAEEDDYKKLYASTVKMLRKMCEKGGRDTESDIYGNPGGYITQLSKKSLEEPCMNCGSPIHKANYMGGTVYFCEKCQKR